MIPPMGNRKKTKSVKKNFKQSVTTDVADDQALRKKLDTGKRETSVKQSNGRKKRGPGKGRRVGDTAESTTNTQRRADEKGLSSTGDTSATHGTNSWESRATGGGIWGGPDTLFWSG